MAKEEEKGPKVSSNSELENSENKIPKIKVNVVNDFESLDKLIQRLDKTNEIVSLATLFLSKPPLLKVELKISICRSSVDNSSFCSDSVRSF